MKFRLFLSIDYLIAPLEIDKFISNFDNCDFMITFAGIIIVNYMKNEKTIQLRNADGTYIPSAKLSEAIKAFIDLNGEDYLKNQSIVVDLANCMQVHSCGQTLELMEKLIKDGITEWLLDAYDDDDSLQEDIENYAKEECLNFKDVFKICNAIEEAIGGTYHFEVVKDNNNNAEIEQDVKQETKSSNANRNSERVCFKGIPLCGNIEDFVEEQRKKEHGLCEWEGLGKRTLRLTFGGLQRDCDVHYTAISHIVYMLVMDIFQAEVYSHYKSIYTQKYGNPELSTEGDKEKSTFYLSNGSISVKEGYNLTEICYTNDENYKLFEFEQDQQLMNDI